MKNDNMQDILKNYYAAGGKTLFETTEQLDEIDFKKAAATALAVGSMAGGDVSADPGAIPGTEPGANPEYNMPDTDGDYVPLQIDQNKAKRLAHAVADNSNLDVDSRPGANTFFVKQGSKSITYKVAYKKLLTRPFALVTIYYDFRTGAVQGFEMLSDTDSTGSANPGSQRITNSEVFKQYLGKSIAVEGIVESAEQLDEGPIGKALATAALALGLSFGNQVNAEEVFVYQDMQGQLQTATSMWDIPDDVMQSYVVDTDTKKIKFLKKPNTPNDNNQEVQNPPIVDKALELLTMGFFDKESVRFTNLRIYTLQDNTKVLGGYVNGKNRMGGYVGEKPFYSVLSGKLDQPERDNFTYSNYMDMPSSDMGEADYTPSQIPFLFNMWADNMSTRDWKKLKSGTTAGFPGGNVADTGVLNTLTPAKSISYKDKNWASTPVMNVPAQSNSAPAQSNTIDHGINISRSKTGFAIDSIDPGSPAVGKLQPGDIITSLRYKGKNIDGRRDFNDIRNEINSLKGKKVVFQGTRNNKAFFVAVKL